MNISLQSTACVVWRCRVLLQAHMMRPTRRQSSSRTADIQLSPMPVCPLATCYCSICIFVVLVELSKAVSVVSPRNGLFYRRLSDPDRKNDMITYACICLHNWLIEKRDVVYAAAQDSDDRSNRPSFDSVQQIGVSSHARYAFDVRERFKLFFNNEGKVDWQSSRVSAGRYWCLGVMFWLHSSTFCYGNKSKHDTFFIVSWHSFVQTLEQVLFLAVFLLIFIIILTIRYVRNCQSDAGVETTRTLDEWQHDGLCCHKRLDA